VPSLSVLYFVILMQSLVGDLEIIILVIFAKKLFRIAATVLSIATPAGFYCPFFF
jgi:ABC-type multidrug transport system permease subunit